MVEFSYPGEDSNDYAALDNAIRWLNLSGKAKAQYLRNCTDLPIYIYIYIHAYDKL